MKVLALRYAPCHTAESCVSAIFILLIASTSRADSFFRSFQTLSPARLTWVPYEPRRKAVSSVLMHQIVTNEASSARRELSRPKISPLSALVSPEIYLSAHLYR